MRIEDADGSIVEVINTAPKGSPADPLTDDEVIDKFTRLAVPVLGSDGAVELVGLIESLESAPTLQPLSQLLLGPVRSPARAGGR